MYEGFRFSIAQNCRRFTAILHGIDLRTHPLHRPKNNKYKNLSPWSSVLRPPTTLTSSACDGLRSNLLDLPELSGTFSIGPTAPSTYPLRALYVEGLTVEELRYFLTQQFSTYVRDPQVYVRPVVYRPVRIYVGGEVKRPGYYTLSGETNLRRLSESANSQQLQAGTALDLTRPGLSQVPGGASASIGGNSLSTSGALFPTVFDAIRTANGVTPYSDLAQVQVTRKRAQALGGGRIRTNLNFLSLITEGNESQNIRLFDGDVVSVSRSKVVLREQLVRAGETNLSPQFINVFVSGRVKTPGGVCHPPRRCSQSGDCSGRRPAYSRARWNSCASPAKARWRQTFNYNPGAAANSPNNPVLMAGDLITIKESPLSATATVINELTAPAMGIYSVYSLFNGFSQ